MMTTEPCGRCEGAPVPVEGRAAHAALHRQIDELAEQVAELVNRVERFEQTAREAGDVWRSVAA